MHHFELANEGLLSVAEFVRINGDWNFLLEECVLLAMDLEQHARIAPEGSRRVNPNFSTRLMLDHFFGEKRPYEGEADRIEWSCNESVLGILFRSKSPPDLGKKLRGWLQNNPRKRPPLVHVMAGASIVFFKSRHRSLKCLDEPGAQRFLEQTRQLARAAGQDLDELPRD